MTTCSVPRRTPAALTGERGTTLFEALIACLVLALGMLTVARGHGHLQLSADAARQRSEAVRLAQEDIETLRAFSVLAAAPGAASFEAIASATRTVDAVASASTTRYTVERQIDPAGAAAGAKSVRVTVRWADRAGDVRQVVLNTLIAAADPAFGGALALERGSAPVRGAYGRSVHIPPGAQDLGDGRSAFKPESAGTVAYLFDQRSGALTARCTGVPAGTPTRALTTAALGVCSAWSGGWLGGAIRFSSALPPDPTNANDVPLALSVEVVSGSGAATACHVVALKTVRYSGAAGERFDAVPLAALPASLGLAAWVETGERYLAYHCAVERTGGAPWTGRVAITPTGWRIGPAAGERRVCRHTSDLDGSGAVDAAFEHPAARSGVDTHLRHQDFLVVDASAACPAGRAVRIAGNNTDDVPADLSTAPHAP